MKKAILVLTLFINFFLLSTTVEAAQDALEGEVNKKCFSCHGQAIYQFTNPKTGKILRRTMSRKHIINEPVYKGTVHKNFKCTYCHPAEYETFPHDGLLRMKELHGCIDCHGLYGRKPLPRYDDIESEFQKSIHYSPQKDFSCWSCHNPHTDVIHVSTENISIKDLIAKDNSICLKCHGNIDEFRLMSDRKEINIMKTHDWLPNESLHFKKVRCIECHTEQVNNPVKSHFIQPSKKAVKLCSECHSKNTVLSDSLYSFNVKKSREGEGGFMNSLILNEAYVIGANRNEWLSRLSIIIFTIVVCVIFAHALLRIFFRK
ncbi:MAG: hypothetical protein HQK84_03355 [Nitrospinae bacterium]|nr:hypothetical protein [Nitrospinota bacterium]